MMRLQRLREDASAAFAAAVDAVRPESLLAREVLREDDRWLVAGRALPERGGSRVVVALGKAAPGLALAWQRTVSGWADETFVLAPHGVSVPSGLNATVRLGGHPLPDAAGERATGELLDRVRRLGPGDVLLVLLSGGASALLAATTEPVELQDVRETTRLLLGAGLPIADLNTVRRELLEAAGGGLARAARPAAVMTLVLSDVVGNTLPDIGSGPTVASPTCATDALAVLRRAGVVERIPERVMKLLERGAAKLVPVHDDLARSRVVVLGDNRMAVDAAAARMAALGYRAPVITRPLTGEAAARGAHLGALARALRFRSCVVLGGETTVTVRGRGVGGRNQEVALAAAIELDGGPPRVVLAGGTDGIDGTSENAGAVVDPGTAGRMRASGVEPGDALAENDSTGALERAGDVIRTGATGTNVCDVAIVAG